MLLDTNIISAHFRRPGGLAHRFIQYLGRLHVPTIVLAELYTWAHRRPDPTPLLTLIAELVQEVTVLPFDSDAAVRFGQVRGPLMRQGISVNTTDLMIAAIALVHNLTLVTNNTADFRNIPGLRLMDWLTP